MIESLTGTHAEWVVGIARIVLGIIFFGHGAQKKRWGGMADLVLPAACARSPNNCTLLRLCLFL
jgi:uncharacterized membrane protein YphA (DoxX/SURF4 family)